ncbi:hypothetical protein PAHAL_4G071800 [Panicum hallii]|jgi:hypothetical protein|uniref:3'-5' exonuclease domain-containing protein n=1 Tax=Panicum hallii TaxID=206008 RepID=A0A2S3HHN7_9POAL|nr:Werner Syndrome-like exonuclease [Panicum hallii]PAN23154.1 hypothetical protein PAHAL_4G071800 [Panicum hallii]
MVARSTVRVDGRAVQTKLTARSAVARRWLYTTLWRHRRTLHSAAGLTVGLDVQWTPPFGRLPAGAEPRPGTLQLCAGNRCLVFQLAQAARVPRILRRFLADARVMFAAYNVGSDRRKLYAHHGLEVRSVLELRGAAGMGNASLADMASRLLRIHGVEKPWEIRTSEWDGLRLSPEQVRYASIDAYISCCLGVYLRRRAMASIKSETESSDDDTESTASESMG